MTDLLNLRGARKRCRNPKCRSKLPEPTLNEREAFCTRGCYRSFYLRRCIVCEASIERRTEQQLICGKRPCRNALQARNGLGRYLPPSDRFTPTKKSIKPGLKTRIKPCRGSVQVAGPQLTPDQLAAATVPDGGEHKRTEAKNRAALEDGGYFTTPDWQEVISPHGVHCFVTRFRDQVPTSATMPPSAPTDLPDDLTIPAFLRRVP